MTTTARPTTAPSWTSGLPTQIAAPTSDLQASGFTAGQRPAYQHINYLYWLLGQWVQYLDAQANGQVSGLEVGNAMRLTGGGTWSYSATAGTLSWSEPFVLSTPSIADTDNTVAAGSINIQVGQMAYVVANLPFTTTGNTQSGSTALTQLPYELGIVVGQYVTGAGIPSNTTVTAVANGQVTMSAAATASASNVNLTFAGTATPNVQVANVASLLPSPNVIVVATCTTAGAIVGVNSGQMRLSDGEQKRLLGTGYLHTEQAQAGQALSAGQCIYLSPGTETDSFTGTVTSGSTTMTNVSSTALLMPGSVLSGSGLPSGTTVTAVGSGSLSLSAAATSSVSAATYTSTRIAGAAYLTTTVGYAAQANVVGIVITTPTISATVATPVRYMMAGTYGGFTGLTPGALYYLDYTTNGGITSTKPAAYRYTVPVGCALSPTLLYVKPPASAQPPTGDFQANSILVAPMAGDTNTSQILLTTSSGTAFSASYTGNVTASGSLQLGGSATVTASLVANSVTSAQGLKCIGPTAHYWGNGTAASGSYSAMQLAVVASAGSSAYTMAPMIWVAPRAGSVTALSVGFSTSNTIPFVFRLNIGGTVTAQLISATGSAYQVFAKGTYSFTAGQAISIQCGPTSGSPAVVVTANFEVELPA